MRVEAKKAKNLKSLPLLPFLLLFAFFASISTFFMRPDFIMRPRNTPAVNFIA
jgi:hypothetical protein